MQLIMFLNAKAETKGLFSINPLNNLKLVGAVAVSAILMYLAIYNPVLGSIFRAVPLTGEQLRTVLTYCVFVPIVSGIILMIKTGHQRIPSPQNRPIKRVPIQLNREKTRHKAGFSLYFRLNRPYQSIQWQSRNCPPLHFPMRKKAAL